MENISGIEVQNLNNIYLSEGKIQENWRLFFEDMKNESYTENILLFLKNKIINHPENLITLDIIDLMIDYGSPKTLNLIAQKEFIKIILNLLKKTIKAGIENKKKVIYLIQKWAIKFSNNKNYQIFQEYYKLLKTKGIIFPPENYRLSTYDKYIVKKNNQNIKNRQTNDLNKDNEEDDNDFRLLKSKNIINNNDINNDNNYNNINNNNILNNNNFEDNSFNNDNNNDLVNVNNNINNDDNDIDYSNYFGNDNNEETDNPNNNQNNDYNINNQNNFNQEKPINRINDYYNSNPYYDENNELNHHQNLNDEKIFYDSWIKKLNEYNGYIDEIYYLKNQNLKLKEGIKEILFTFPKIDIMINNCKEKRDNVGEKNLLNIKSDMEQTCDRYECLLRGKNIEPFMSILKGNTRKYYFNKNYLNEKLNIVSNKEDENSIMDSLEKLGNSIKDNAFLLGKIIKDNTIKGFNYVKDKITDDSSNSKNINENEIQKENCNSVNNNNNINHNRNNNNNNNLFIY